MGLCDKVKTRRGLTIAIWAVLLPVILLIVILLPLINKTFELAAFIMATFLRMLLPQ